MKKFKTKSNKQNIKYIIIIVIFFILFIFLSFIKLDKSNSKLINYLANNFSKDDKLSFNLLTSNLDNLISVPSFKEQKTIYHQKKRIYLYNTHNLEKYDNNLSIIEVTNILKDKLEKLGIEVIVEEKKTSELLHTGLSYYDISKTFLKEVINDNSIAYFIDIHRDSVSNTRVKLNDKDYAQILFVLGLENDNYPANKEVLMEMNNYLNDNYPHISRGIYEKKGDGVDGVYNQDLSSKVLLIELGGVNNTLEEVNNSTEIIALMLYHMIGEFDEDF